MGCKMPIIAVTANITPEERQRYMDADMSDCLSKPINRQELWSCLLRYLPTCGQKSVDVIKAQEQNGQAIDWAQGLENCAGNTAFYENTLKAFQGKALNVFTQVENAVYEGNYKLAHQLCHHEISTVTLIGAVKLAEILISLASLTKEGTSVFQEKEISCKVDAYRSELQRVLSEK